MNISKSKSDNIPVPAALLLLAGVLWVLIAGPNLESMATLGDQIESFIPPMPPILGGVGRV